MTFGSSGTNMAQSFPVLMASPTCLSVSEATSPEGTERLMQSTLIVTYWRERNSEFNNAEVEELRLPAVPLTKGVIISGIIALASLDVESLDYSFSTKTNDQQPRLSVRSLNQPFTTCNVSPVLVVRNALSTLLSVLCLLDPGQPLILLPEETDWVGKEKERMDTLQSTNWPIPTTHTRFCLRFIFFFRALFCLRLSPLQSAALEALLLPLHMACSPGSSSSGNVSMSTKLVPCRMLVFAEWCYIY